MRLLTLDRKKKNRSPTNTRRAERLYAKQLTRLADQVGLLINGFPAGDPSALPTIEDLLRRYAEALTPWAVATAGRMVEEVNTDDLKAWQRMGADLSRNLRKEIIVAPTGKVMRELMDLQVTLIKSIPIDAAQRVHKLTIEGLEDSTRASEIAKAIMESGNVAKSRAMLIARTEVARTAANLTQARAQHVGSQGYIWQTSKDGDVRSSHKRMQGRYVEWGSPPTLDNLTGHAGCLPNCRCWAYVLIPD